MGTLNQPETNAQRSSLIFWFSTALAALVLRLGAATLIMWCHGIDHGLDAWRGIWHDAPWPLLDGIAQLGLPWPKLLGTITVILGLGACLLWVVGLLTRVASITMLFILVGFGSYFLLANDLAAVELTTVYAVLALALFIMGGGPLSLDLLFRRTLKKTPESERRALVTPAPSRGRGWLQ